MRSVIEDHYISNDTVESVGEFAILWGMVEDKYFKRNCSAANLSKMVVVNNCDDLIISAKEIKATLFSEYDSVDEIISYMCFRKIDNSLKKQVIRFLSEDELDAEIKIFAAVCICFRIRNNMFHGEKCFYLLNQQRKFFNACSGFLNELVLREDVL